MVVVVAALPPLWRSGVSMRRSAGLLLLRPRPHVVCQSGVTSRRMSSRGKPDHMERTVNNFRQEVIAPAKVCGIMNESETVKRLRLTVLNKDFTFKAGQWVDFFVPGVPKVGGFSICSSPGLLKREGVLELAVKITQHPPAQWVHSECVLGSEVTLRVGGDFFFDLQPSNSSVDLLLVAGGVGINPLYSILLHVADLHRLHESKDCELKPGTVQLYFSAKNSEELLFKKTIIDLSREFPGKINCHFHVTQQVSEISENLKPHVTAGRISEMTLSQHVSKNNICFICGPPPMIESVSQQLEKLGVAKENIIFEKWW